MCSEAKVESDRVRSGKLTQEDWPRLTAACDRLMKAPIYVDDTGSITMMELRSKARRLKAKEPGLGLIIVDYLQLMTSGGTAENRVQEVSQISRNLKVLARDLDVPILALSQLSRAVEQRHDKRPILSDLRESGLDRAGRRPRVLRLPRRVLQRRGVRPAGARRADPREAPQRPDRRGEAHAGASLREVRGPRRRRDVALTARPAWAVRAAARAPVSVPESRPRRLAAMTTCAACGQQNPDGARFCNACGQALAGVAPAREERKVVTVVFADLVGSTNRAERLDPEDVRALLGPFHARLRHELERYGGTVEKFIGDAVVAVFGAPAAHDDDPERAVRAAIAIQEAIAELNEADPSLALEVRIGVNTGEALVALDARPELGEAMVSGDVINTCARLQSGAAPGAILVGEQTRRAVERAIELVEHPPLAAKGKSEPVLCWQVVGRRASFGLEDDAVGRAPLVGRAREVALLVDALARSGASSAPSS